MSNLATQNGLKEVSSFLNGEAIKLKFKEMMGDRANTFLSSAMTVISQNKLLHNATKESIYNTLLISASLNLPINPSLGFAYIVPYNESYKDENGRWLKRQVAQLQIGYKGIKQLAIRSGQYKTMGAKPVFEGQLIDDSSFLGYHFNWQSKKSDVIIGYVSHFELLTGYTSTFYMTIEQITAHAKKYSQTFKKGEGKWAEDFEKMALKTVSKLHLNNGEAPLSVEMQKAIIADQAVIKDAETLEVSYIDNTQPSVQEIQAEQETQRIIDFISQANNVADLEDSGLFEASKEYGLMDMLEAKKEELKSLKK